MKHMVKLPKMAMKQMDKLLFNLQHSEDVNPDKKIKVGTCAATIYLQLFGVIVKFIYRLMLILTGLMFSYLVVFTIIQD